jgi:uracil-DNA glycosylase
VKLAREVPEPWRRVLGAALEEPWARALEEFVTEERKVREVLPPPACTFAALERTAPAAVKVVLLGQDPYPTPGNAMGLSFSVPRGVRVPASLRNVYRVLEQEVPFTAPGHGDLSAWADRGALLLNAVLTVRAGEASSHQGKGWETFTAAVLGAVDALPTPLVFLNLGKAAQATARAVVRRHPLVDAPHPSPLNRSQPFVDARPFAAVNRALVEQGGAPFDWRLEA